MASEYGVYSEEAENKLKENIAKLSIDDVTNLLLQRYKAEKNAEEANRLLSIENALAGNVNVASLKNALKEIENMHQEVQKTFRELKALSGEKTYVPIKADILRTKIQEQEGLDPETLDAMRHFLQEQISRMSEKEDKARVADISKDIRAHDAETESGNETKLTLPEARKKIGFSVDTLQRGLGISINLSKLKLGEDLARWNKLASKFEALRRSFVKDTRPKDVRDRDHERRVKELLDTI